MFTSFVPVRTIKDYASTLRHKEKITTQDNSGESFVEQPCRDNESKDNNGEIQNLGRHAFR